MENIFSLIETFNKSNDGVTFCFVGGYTSKSYEHSKSEDYLINIGADYGKAKAKDIETLKNLSAEQLNKCLKSITDERVTLEVLETAKQDLIASFIKPDVVRSQAQADAYTKITPNGSLKYAENTGNINISGLLVKSSNKQIIDSETYNRIAEKKANVKSRALTVAKNSLKKFCDLRTDKWIYLSVALITSKVSANKDTLSFESK